MRIPDIHINDFNYDLPKERIPKYPLPHRDQSKLLIYRKGEIEHTEFFRLHESMSSPTSLIFNNSRVICARLLFKKDTGAKIEIFCLEPFKPGEYQQNFHSTSSVLWKCLIGNKKKWKYGKLIKIVNYGSKEIVLEAQYCEDDSEKDIIKFSWNDKSVSFGEILDQAGKIPIPPYLMRESEDSDRYRYQTIYSRIKGSVAAPTAGLHFTPRVFEQLDNKGIEHKELTLHVGAGTFKPVQSENISDHEMHEETFTINLDQLQFIRKNLGNIIAVGTTSTRLLESIYQMGVKCLRNENDIHIIRQWDSYINNYNIPAKHSLDKLINWFNEKEINELVTKTSIMIVPGYQFKMIKGLITNFHQPKSTLLLLIAALIGDDWKKVYQYALENNFRFLSYGDSSLLIPNFNK